MDEKETKKIKDKSMKSVEKIESEIHEKCDEIIVFCKEKKEDVNFYSFEKALKNKMCKLGCLFIQLFLMSIQNRLTYCGWLATGKFYEKKVLLSRTINTIYGKVRYWRKYLYGKEKGEGLFPLDIEVGLTKDGFSPLVISLVTKLATRVSFETSVLLFRCFNGWSPSSESIQALVLGMGRETNSYMEMTMPFEGDGEVLVIQTDGKATPTATEEELSKRRGKRKAKKQGCNCKRHRGKAKRKCCKSKRRKKGDKSKNGRSITLVVMYTLKRGKDDKLHGPLNKKVWGSYVPRKVMLEWARNQATMRGFPLDTNKRIHIVIDGERCLKKRLSVLFPTATFALDICHLEEYIWEAGRAFYKEGSKELEKWVESKRKLLYKGHAAKLLFKVKELRKKLSRRAKKDKSKRDALSKLIKYMEPRLDMMEYKSLIEEDLDIASGVVEGAARYVIGERMDCSGMRWIPERAEALLHLRCIELNGEWDRFFDWSYNHWRKKLKEMEKVIVRTEIADDLSSEYFVEEQEVSVAA